MNVCTLYKKVWTARKNLFLVFNTKITNKVKRLLETFPSPKNIDFRFFRLISKSLKLLLLIKIETIWSRNNKYLKGTVNEISSESYFMERRVRNTTVSSETLFDQV